MSIPADSKPPSPAVRGRGRPRKLDDAKRNKICAVVAIGCDLRRAAQYAGCSYPTLRREILRNPEFAEQLRRARRRSARIKSLGLSHRDIDRLMSAREPQIPIEPHNPFDDL